jgi:hypothetical protein
MAATTSFVKSLLLLEGCRPGGTEVGREEEEMTTTVVVVVAANLICHECI